MATRRSVMMTNKKAETSITYLRLKKDGTHIVFLMSSHNTLIDRVDEIGETTKMVDGVEN